MTVNEYNELLKDSGTDDELRTKLVNAFRQGVKETNKNFINFLQKHCNGGEFGTNKLIISFEQEKLAELIDDNLK